MLIVKATTNAAILLRAVHAPEGEGGVVILQPGSEVSAIQIEGENHGYHVNAQVDGYVYDGYCGPRTLESIEVLATVNEGAWSNL